MPRVLVIQFRANTVAMELEATSIAREIGTVVAADFMSALDTKIHWSDPAVLLASYAGVVFGGSGDFDFDGERPADDPARVMSSVLLQRLRPLCEYLFLHDIPTLGICFGHQLIGAFAGASVSSDPRQRKTRSHEVELLVENHDLFLFTDVPKFFTAQYGHKDVLTTVPPGAVLLATGGEACQVSVLRYKENIYSTQFHPELTVEDMTLRTKHFPGYLPEGVVVQEIFQDSPDAHKILHNFAKLLVIRAEVS